MVQRKRHSYQRRHLFDTYAFEAFVLGSWQPVECIKFESGAMILQFLDDTHMEMEKGPSSDIRIRSRKATSVDCSCLFRPGVDISVLSIIECNDDSDLLNTDPVWLDARINSIERKPHKSGCSCQYYVNFYATQGSLGTRARTVSKEVKVVGIDQISVLQRLERNSCEDQSYRWALAEDCYEISETKLLSGKFLSDISWLAVTSVIKGVSFGLRSVNNKIVYQILGNDSDNFFSLSPGSFINVVNFKTDDKGIIESSVSQVEVSETMRIAFHESDSSEDELSLSYDVGSLRRSTRLSKKPELYLGYEIDDSEVEVEVEVAPLQTSPNKKRKKLKAKPYRKATVVVLALAAPADHSNKKGHKNKVSSCKEFKVQRKGNKNKKEKIANKNEDQAQLGSVSLKERVTRSKKKKTHESDDISLSSISKSKKNDIRKLASGLCKPSAKSGDAEEIDDFSSRGRGRYNSRKHQKRKKDSDLDDMGFENRCGGRKSSEGIPKRRHNSTLSRRNRIDDEEPPRKRSNLNADAYKEIIDSYMKDIDTRLTNKEDLPITKLQTETSTFGQNKEAETSQESEGEEEVSETDMLWREMEDAITESCLMEVTQDSTAVSLALTEVNSRKTCEHDTRLDEQIGIYCLKCGVVITEIRDVMAPFAQPRRGRHHQEEKQCNGDSEPKDNEDDDSHAVQIHATPYEPLSIENDNVWSLIPELREKMHEHQKKAFQFLWQNIAGSTEPALMEAESEKRGGCVISHAPGAGKTFLVIAFLASYLKLFPGKKPLVLAPKTTLYTWHKEFIKWQIPVPVYLIHGRRNQVDFNETTLAIPGVPKPSGDVKHVLDCLEKIKKWHAHPSVLVMGYTSFLSLTRENSKYEHRRYMAKALRESTGVLILDEGHNPRSTKSRLRKGLMKVETELRILLSGTLFQNNFCEYFNTLCLARPKFVQEVLKELDTKQRKGNKTAEKAQHLVESRARKFFLDNIANKIDSSNDEVRMQGLNMLRKITSGFIDVYESGNSDRLPGLQIYTLLMNTTDMQNELLEKLRKKMAECNVYPLELELMVTLASIHPWLIKTATCAPKFYTSRELKRLDKFKSDLRVGSKVRFILSLILRVVKKEKVLIFCRNLAPMRLLVQFFEEYFKWKKGREILLLYGEQELFERGKVIDKFEDPCGVSKVLLASITACAEGISLTAASRVIFLDSEWNPSKTKQAIARAFRPGQEKMVYVYQLLAKGSMEEDKYRRTTWKEWLSSMIFSEDFVEDPSQWQAEKIEDDILREIVEEDKSKAIHMIMKNEKASTN